MTTVPKITPEVQLGQLLQIATFLLSIGGGIWYMSGAIEGLNKDIVNLRNRTARLEPLVADNGKADNIQDERIKNVVKAIQDIRESSTLQGNQLTGVRESLATIQAQLNYYIQYPRGSSSRNKYNGP